MDFELDESFDTGGNCLADLLVPEVNLDIEMKELDLPENNNTWPFDTLSYFLPIIPLKKLSQEDIETTKQDLNQTALEVSETLPTIPLLRLSKEDIRYIRKRLKLSKLPQICGKLKEKKNVIRSKKPKYCQKCNIIPGRFHEQFHESIICSSSFKCPICEESFDESDMMKFNKHFTKHYKVNKTRMFSLPCLKCPFIGKCGLEVLQHVLDEHFPEDFEMKCYHCEFSTSNFLDLHDHLKRQHFFSYLICPICGKWVYRGHTEMVHGISDKVAKKILEKLRQSERKAKSPIKKKEREIEEKEIIEEELELIPVPDLPVAYQHFLDFEEPEEEKENLPTEDIPWRKRGNKLQKYRRNHPRYCPTCEKVSSIYHKQVHENIVCNPFNCPVCEEYFEDIGMFSAHFLGFCAKEVTKDSASCSLCEFTGISGIEVVQHAIDKHFPQNFKMKCFHCDFSNSNLDKLQEHLRTYHSFVYKMCRVCGIWCLSIFSNYYKSHLAAHGIKTEKYLQSLKAKASN